MNLQKSKLYMRPQKILAQFVLVQFWLFRVILFTSVQLNQDCGNIHQKLYIDSSPIVCSKSRSLINKCPLDQSQIFILIMLRYHQLNRFEQHFLQILREILFQQQFQNKLIKPENPMIQVSLSRGPKRRGISLSSTHQKKDNLSSQERGKVNLSAQPQRNINYYQVFNQNPVQGFIASNANCQPVPTISVATPNAVYYAQSKQNVSFSYSEASQKSKPLSESIMLDKKINQLQSQIAQKHNMLKQIKNTSQRPSPAKKFVEVTQNVTSENRNSFRYQNHASSYPIPSVSTPIVININQNKTPLNIHVPRREQQFYPITKFQPIQVSPMPIVSQEKANFRHQKHQQTQLTIYNHQEFQSKSPGSYPNNYKISPQRNYQKLQKIAPQRTQNFLNSKNTQKQVQKSVQKKDKSAKKKRSKANQQQNSKEVKIKDAKQNIKVQRTNLDYNKLKIMESKLLDIIKVCQQGL